MMIKIGDFQGHLDFNYNSMCLIEESMGLSVMELIGSPEKIGVRAIRSFLYAGLFEQHALTELQIGKMLNDVLKKPNGKDNLRKISRLVVDAMKKSEILSDESQGQGPPQQQGFEKKSPSRKSSKRRTK
jgi:hypothetical protein